MHKSFLNDTQVGYCLKIYMNYWLTDDVESRLMKTYGQSHAEKFITWEHICRNSGMHCWKIITAKWRTKMLLCSWCYWLFGTFANVLYNNIKLFKEPVQWKLAQLYFPLKINQEQKKLFNFVVEHFHLGTALYLCWVWLASKKLELEPKKNPDYCNI